MLLHSLLMTRELLADIAARPFVAKRMIESDAATYFGTAFPLEGVTTILVDDEAVTATLENYDNWEMRSLRALPNGTHISAGGLFRSIAPGHLIPDTQYGSLIPRDEKWEARRCLFISSSRSSSASSDGVFRFSVGRLLIRGSAAGAQVAAVRQLYSRGDWCADSVFDGNELLVRALAVNPKSMNDELLAITVGTELDHIAWEAMWNMASLVSGNALTWIAEEKYDNNGDLISTEYRPSGSVSMGRRNYFHRNYGALAVDGVAQLMNGFDRVLRAKVPIDVVLQHLHESVNRVQDVEAQHLVLAIHTAIEAWNRLFGFDCWIDELVWKKYHRSIRKNLIPKEIYEDLGDEVRANMRSAFAHLNETTTTWRQKTLFDALCIDVSDSDNKRVLDLRNELLHNGYFLRRWSDLTYDERHQRLRDAERLRRLTLLIVFRMSSYEGAYRNPVTLQAEYVTRCPLPALIAPRVDPNQ